MWPDPEDASDAARAAAVPPERFAFLPRHVACDWAACGALGMFQSQLRGPGEEPCVVRGRGRAWVWSGAGGDKLGSSVPWHRPLWAIKQEKGELVRVCLVYVGCEAPLAFFR